MEIRLSSSSSAETEQRIAAGRPKYTFTCIDWSTALDGGKYRRNNLIMREQSLVVQGLATGQSRDFVASLQVVVCRLVGGGLSSYDL